MRMIAPARLAVAWLTMFLVGTELFVFSPLLPVLAADYHISAALAGLSVTMSAALSEQRPRKTRSSISR